MRRVAMLLGAFGVAMQVVAWAGESTEPVVGQAAEVAAGEPSARRSPAPLPSFTVTVRDGRFSPARIEVPAGKRVRLELINEGPGPLEFENADMHVEKILAAGARSFVVLPSLQPGEHSFIDEFNPITGELFIVAK